MRRRDFLMSAAAIVLVAPACSDSPSTASSDGVRLVTVDEASALIDERVAKNRVVLDVRTPDEFGDGHLPDAELIDFYDADFAEQIGELDRDVAYVVYCRSGNRSGQARELMRDLGFSDVADVEGGVIAWADSGRELITP